MIGIRKIIAAGIFSAGLLVLSGGAAIAGYADAQRYYDAAEYSKAEKELRALIKESPENARYHQLLGDVYKRQSRLDEALSEYHTAERLGTRSSELMKDLGTVYRWKGNSERAAEYYNKALEINPDDREAKGDLEDLRASKGLVLSFFAGGWEPDYTTSAYEVMLSYSGIRNFDLYAGYGYADQPYYERTKLYAKGYYFYAPGSYFKVNAQTKDYDYPVSTTPVPDSNSYDKVPAVEFEVQHWIRNDLRGNVALEYFRPTFFHDKDSTANNLKLSGELYYITEHEPLRLKLMYALLKDPDPERTKVKNTDLNMPTGVNATETDVQYQTQSLLGAGAEYVEDRWEADFKYMPNRDLDSSYAWSVFLGYQYDFTEQLTGRLDYVHDKYSSQSNFSGQTADVYMGSVRYAFDKRTDLGFGLKHISLPTTDDDTIFVTVSYRTGLGF